MKTCQICRRETNETICGPCFDAMSSDIRQVMHWIAELGIQRRNGTPEEKEKTNNDAAYLITSLPPSLVRPGDALYRDLAGLEPEDDTEQGEESMASSP